MAVGGDIDKLGESANFQVVRDWNQTAFALGIMWSAAVYTSLDIVIAGKFKGHGTAFGAGVGFGVAIQELAGSLSYDSEDTLLSAENEFHIVSASVGGGHDIC